MPPPHRTSSRCCLWMSAHWRGRGSKLWISCVVIERTVPNWWFMPISSKDSYYLIQWVSSYHLGTGRLSLLSNEVSSWAMAMKGRRDEQCWSLLYFELSLLNAVYIKSGVSVSGRRWWCLLQEREDGELSWMMWFTGAVGRIQEKCGRETVIRATEF